MTHDPAAPESLPTPEAKRAALEAVLRSETFPRSGQLRTMLVYICEREIDGRAAEISEYTIGIDVLHRPEGYSVAADSSVRKRAYELRQKLQQVYAAELASAPLRIDIPKGSYIPHFVPAGDPAAPSVASSVASLINDLPPTPLPALARPLWLYGLAALALAAASFAAAWFLRPVLSSSRPEPVLVEAWGPMARPDADVLVCLATNLHLLVRPHLESSSNRVYPAFPELYAAFRNHRPLPQGTDLSMVVADNSVTFGEVWAAALASANLRTFGASHQILPESAVPIPALRKRNAVIVGVPADSLVVSDLLAHTPYTVGYSPEAHDQALLDRRGGTPKPSFPTQGGDAYGLLTVVPSDGVPARQKQIVVFSGVGSAPAQAAAEFFCSATHLADLKRRLAQQSHSRFPTAYQVVVRCRTSQGLLVSWEYVTHVVITP